MLVFWKERLVFLAVPKTGSSAYEAALKSRASMSVMDPPELKHAPIYRYNRFFRPMFEKAGADNMETLAVVRDPLDWLGSWFRYRKRPFLNGKPASTAGVDFEDFVLAYMKGDKPPYANVGSQAKFLEPRPNGVRINHLFRYENQPALQQFIESRLNVTLDLPKTNVSPEMDLTVSTETEKMFRKKCANEYEVWESGS
ncbi:sulfotransferase family 2 domain-containing protein [Primorskyibacter marinus]|uniref:sulfotransferase family 2 domain-containing protein n=1 Tax=Primorskyibacter marinus TaxID=1977320 RepID=UPI000E3006BD|nr:sulfotransferase family 2 domain-containing protein [Primorskyibacter marinus]